MSRVRALGAAATVAMLAPLVAQAQTTDLPAIDVTASQPAPAEATAPPLKERYDLPQTSASVTADQIRQTVNILDTEDAVKYFPSLFVRKRNYGDTQPVLATRTWGVGSSARSLVYADDIPITALIANNNTIGAPRWGMVAPEEIARVDFLYGPFSAAYPGNSMGGVLQITTRMPDKFEFNAKQTEAFQGFDRYGTSGTYRTDQSSVSAGDRKGNVSWFLSGNFQNSDSQPLIWITSATSPAGTSGAIPALNKLGQPANVVGAGGLLHTDQATVKGKVAWDITPWLTAAYTLGFWSNVQASSVQTYLTTASGAPTYGGVAAFASNRYYLNEQHLSNAVSLRTDTRGAFDFDIAVSRYDYLDDSQMSPAGVVGNTAAFTNSGKLARMDGTSWTNADAKGIWRAGRHEVSFGLHADRYELNNPTYTTPQWTIDATNGVSTVGKGKTETVALWAQDAWRFAPGLKLTLGGREEAWRAFDGFNLSGGTAIVQPTLDAQRFSPKASLEWQASQDWVVTASFGQAYRFPTVSELYQIVQIGAVFANPNPNLRPENVLSEELAIERRLGGGSVRLSLFNEHVSDALISQSNLVNGGSSVAFVTNVDAVRNTGVELAASRDNVLIDGLTPFGSVTWVDSRILSDPGFVNAAGVPTDVTGKHVPNVPDWRATFGATYKPNEAWSFTAAARYSGKQYSTLDNTDVVSNVAGAFDSFFVVDLRAQYAPNPRTTIGFGIDNVGNEQYTLYHPFPSRTFIVDARVTF